MPILKPPAPLVWSCDKFSVFLAGSIENGQAPPWQARVEEALTFYDPVIVNPRRDQWDPNPSPELLREQIEWELEGLERVSMIAMYFAPETKSPVTLLEMGLFARDSRLLVCCPEGYWRKANVDITCERYGIAQTPSLEGMIARIIRKISVFQKDRVF